MIALAGGLVAFVLGIVGLVVWWCSFLTIIKGGIPVILILGGALAIYMGAEEFKEKRRASREAARSPLNYKDNDESIAKYKDEVMELKKRLAALEEQNLRKNEAAGD